jgi:flagellar protein FlaG
MNMRCSMEVNLTNAVQITQSNPMVTPSKKQELLQPVKETEKQALHKKTTTGNNDVRIQTESLVKNLTTDKIQMHYDKEINRVVIQIVDSESQEVVKQIPAEEAVNYLKNFEKALGALINGRV